MCLQCIDQLLNRVDANTWSSDIKVMKVGTLFVGTDEGFEPHRDSLTLTTIAATKLLSCEASLRNVQIFMFISYIYTIDFELAIITFIRANIVNFVFYSFVMNTEISSTNTASGSRWANPHVMSRRRVDGICGFAFCELFCPPFFDCSG